MSTACWWAGMALLNGSLVLFLVGALRRELNADLMPWGLVLLTVGQILVAVAAWIG